VKLMRVETGSEQAYWTIYAVCAANGECPLLNSLQDLEAAGDEAMVSKFAALLRYVVKRSGGPRELRKEKSRQLDKDHRIWEFKAGHLRVPYFYEEGSVIICTHSFVKDTRQTPSSEKKAATRTKAAFEEAKKSGTLEWC